MKALSFDDISLVPRYNNITSRRDVDTSVQFGDLKLRIPVFSSNMDTVTDARMARRLHSLGGLGFLHRFCSIEDNAAMYYQARIAEPGNSHSPDAVVSLGVNEGLDRFHALYEVGARYFCVDIAHGHSQPVGRLVEQIKQFDSSVFVVAGNVCENAGASYLADKGADAIKVGIGPGSVCTTRRKSGFGIPQFTAIRECHRVNCFVIADGGIRTPGDVVKALYAGADAVMIGGMFAGCDETPGDFIEDTIWESASPAGFLHRKVKVYRGMASKEAQDEFMGSMHDWKTSEGVEIKVLAKGPVSDVVTDLMGGVRSGMTYCGANELSQIRQRTYHVEVSAAGAAEGTAHGRNQS